MASNTNSPARSKLFNKGLIGRLGAVGLFVALGTFAVIQSLNGPTPEEEIASAEDNGIDGDPAQSGSDDSISPKVPDASSNAFDSPQSGDLNKDGIRVGGVASSKVAMQKPSIGQSLPSQNGNQSNSIQESSAPSKHPDNGQLAESSDQQQQGSDLLNVIQSGGFKTNRDLDDSASAPRTAMESGDSLSKPPSSFNAGQFNPKSAFSPSQSMSNSAAPKLLNDSQQDGFNANAGTGNANTESAQSNNNQSTPPPSNPTFGGNASFGSLNPTTPTEQLGASQNGNSGQPISAFDPTGSKAKVENTPIAQESFDPNGDNSSSGFVPKNAFQPKPVTGKLPDNGSNDQASDSGFSRKNNTTLANSSTSENSITTKNIESSMPNVGQSGQPVESNNPNNGFLPNSNNPSGSMADLNSQKFQPEQKNSLSNNAGIPPRSTFNGTETDQGPGVQQQSSGFNPQKASGGSFQARPVAPHESLNTNQINPNTSNLQKGSTGVDTSGDQSSQTSFGNTNQSTQVPSTLPSSTRMNQQGNAIPTHDVSHTVSTTPGDRKFEGLQTPSLTLEKVAPGEIQVGRAAKFELIVKNVGNVAAQHVVVHDTVPEGTRLQNTVPQAQQTSTGQLSWHLGTIAPGTRKVIELSIVPTQRGEIGSVATVSFAATAAVRTRSTKPELIISHRGPARVLIGDPVTLEIKVENRGDGAAENITIQEQVPEGFEFQNGIRDLEYSVGTLGPGKSKTIKLNLLAKKIGNYKNTMVAFGEGPLKSQDSIEIEVIAPQLLLSGTGPKRRYLNRPATHQFSVQNKGTAAATNVEMVARLPRGLTFVSTDKQGRYDSRTHSVFWTMPTLQINTQETVQLETRPTTTGDQTINFEIAADRNRSHKTEQTLTVEQLAELFFDIDDTADPIELGSDTSYRVKVVNQGAKIATNIRVVVEFPEAITPSAINGGSGNEIQGQTVTLPKIPQLSPGEEKSIAIKAKGIRVGDHRVVIKVQSDDRTVAESKQESTKVYSDR